MLNFYISAGKNNQTGYFRKIYVLPTIRIEIGDSHRPCRIDLIWLIFNINLRIVDKD